MKARILVYGDAGTGKSIVIDQIVERAEFIGLTVDVRHPICEHLHQLPDDPIKNQFCDISIQEIQNYDIEVNVSVQGVFTTDDQALLFHILNDVKTPEQPKGFLLRLPLFPVKQ